MSKKTEDKVEELEEWKQKQEIKRAIEEGISTRVRAVCITATGAVITAVYSAGGWVYDHFAGLSAAVRAFLLVDKGGQ